MAYNIEKFINLKNGDNLLKKERTQKLELEVSSH